MKKMILLVLAAFMAIGFAGNAFADTRLDGMSADPRAVEDMDLIWLYPNKALQYKNTVDVRLADSNAGYFATWDTDFTEWGGILKDAGDIGTIGLYSGRPTIEGWDGGYSDTYNGGNYWFQNTANDWVDWSRWGYNMLYSAWTPVGGVNWNSFDTFAASGAVLDPYNKLDAFWAKGFGDIDLGVHASYGDNQSYVTNTSNDSRTLGVQIGLGMTSLAPFNEANFHVGYAMGSVDTGGANPTRDNGIFTLSAGTLLVSNLDGDNSLRLYGDANLDQFALQGNDSAINNQFQSLAGVAVNHKLGKGLINSSLSFSYGDQMIKYSTTGTEYDYAWWDVIWNVGFETPLSGWLTYRVGLSKPVFERYFERDGVNTAASYGDRSTNSWSALNMGLTANVENLTIDALMNVGALENFLGNPNLNQVTFDNSSTFTSSGPGPLSLVEVDLKAKI